MTQEIQKNALWWRFLNTVVLQRPCLAKVSLPPKNPRWLAEYRKWFSRLPTVIDVEVSHIDSYLYKIPKAHPCFRGETVTDTIRHRLIPEVDSSHRTWSNHIGYWVARQIADSCGWKRPYHVFEDGLCSGVKFCLRFNCFFWTKISLTDRAHHLVRDTNNTI